MNSLEHTAIFIGSAFAGSVIVGMLLAVALPVLAAMRWQYRHRPDWATRPDRRHP